MMNLDIELSLFTLPSDFSLAVKSYDMGANSFTSPPKGGVLRIFIALKNPSPSAGFKPANLGSDGKYASHYTTEDDCSFRTIGQLQWMPKTTRRPAGIVFIRTCADHIYIDILLQQDYYGTVSKKFI
jgi:hypothetical protein